MSGSSFGKVFQVTTFGESHGPALGVVVQGCPPGLPIDESMIQTALDKRKPGKGPASTKRKEPDRPRILSGTFEDRTTGTPIMILIENKDARSRSYKDISRLFRPGHGDYSYTKKYGIRDFRGGGRASARETAARVAAGAVAQIVLDQYQIRIMSHTLALGGIQTTIFDPDVIEKNVLRCADPVAAEAMEARIKEVKSQGDSLGGVVEIRAKNVPAGIGDPVFDKLDADIAKALMSIGAVKAVEIGSGLKAAAMTGSENNDEITSTGFQTNHSGGILAGISNGDEILSRVHVKPIPSISKVQKTIDTQGEETTISTKGRHDISAIPRINMVCESMMALVLTDHILRQKTLV
ncbi:chorismate synthase [Desulfospira joergensenii]|uniref:chorismate synthase n=1 Tax=Desulfospira joergensenii TaxID=53329 RepID=UPI0003B4D502|nr:chorismate synthase [Desulfospira joergensenii]